MVSCKFMSEVEERMKRKSNLILFGFPECSDLSSNINKNESSLAVYNFLNNFISNDCLCDIKRLDWVLLRRCGKGGPDLSKIIVRRRRGPK